MSKVLIIDDDKKIILSFSHKLTKIGFEVITAYSALEGLQLLRNCKDIDIVLLDYIMPEMNGLEVFSLIKKEFEIAPPVIMMTFNTDYKLATQFIKKGGVDFIEKSIDPEQLKIKIEQLIKHAQQVKEANQKQLEAEEKLKETNELLLEKTKLLHLQTKALTEANQELQRFMDIVAHDLKEPLRNISNSMQFLKWDFPELITPKSSEYIDFAISGAIRLTHMIQGLTHYANINSTLPFSKIRISQIITEVKANLKGQIEENNATIIENNLPDEIIAHKYQIMQLFQNLISNAIKFKKNNEPPIITINCTENPTYWEFSVNDNGIGFNKNYAERIFNIFHRLHTPQEYQGSGIGLSICQKIVQRHDGNITATATENQGATFIFTISKHLKK